MNRFVTTETVPNQTNQLSKDLLKHLGQYTRCKDINEIYSKLKSLSRSRFKTSNSYYNEVFSAPKCVIKNWTRSMSLVSVPGLYSDLDLEKGTYEGGFKVWESTADLIRFITEDKDHLDPLLHKNREFKALELGAGAGLTTLALIGRILQDSSMQSNYVVHVQDYNFEVLASLTLINFTVNLPLDYLEALISTKCLRFFYGDWRNFRPRCKYSLIYMSEVIYNIDNFESLHSLLDRHLNKKGIVVIATKNTYFGLTGGLFAWKDFLKEKNVFTIDKHIKVTTTNIPRSILVIKRVRSQE